MECGGYFSLPIPDEGILPVKYSGYCSGRNPPRSSFSNFQELNWRCFEHFEHAETYLNPRRKYQRTLRDKKVRFP